MGEGILNEREDGIGGHGGLTLLPPECPGQTSLDRMRRSL
jgi:hypothetical protein